MWKKGNMCTVVLGKVMDGEQWDTQETSEEAWSPIGLFCLTELSFQGLYFPVEFLGFGMTPLLGR